MKKYHLFLLVNITILLFTFPINSKAFQDSLVSLEMYIPEGQVSNRVFRVYIRDYEVTREMNPELILNMNNETTTVSCKLVDVARNQVFMKEIKDEVAVPVSGTLLLFDISSLNTSRFWTSIKVMPALAWDDFNTQSKRKIIHPDCYFIGHGIGTTIWTIAIMVIILAGIGLVLLLRDKKADKKVGQLLGVICDEDGQVSMALLQMGLWTIAVGSMVLAFGLLRLSVPDIPNTLITLMVFAAGTTTAGQYQSKIRMREDKKLNELKGKKDEIDDMSFWMRLNTMFYTEKESDYPSIAKIQVLIWTAITLTLFIYLSINEGELWEVPNELVILMGISQATFLGRQQMAIQDVKKEVEKNDPKLNKNPTN
jgi:hypothetical protein